MNRKALERQKERSRIAMLALERQKERARIDMLVNRVSPQPLPEPPLLSQSVEPSAPAPEPVPQATETLAEAAGRCAMMSLQAKNYCEQTGVACRKASHRCGCFLQFLAIVDRVKAEDHRLSPRQFERLKTLIKDMGVRSS